MSLKAQTLKDSTNAKKCWTLVSCYMYDQKKYSDFVKGLGKVLHSYLSLFLFFFFFNRKGDDSYLTQ